jgi:hypothetical protein
MLSLRLSLCVNFKVNVYDKGLRLNFNVNV